MTITLCGPNAYEVRNALNALVKAFTKKHTTNAIERLDGITVTPPQLREQVSALSLFASQRLIILKDPSANKELFVALEDILGQVQDGVTLVVVDNVLDKRTKTYKVLKSKTDFREFAIPSEPQLLQWITKRVQDSGGQIAPADARLLLEYVGDDQWQLASEIEKLLAFNVTITAATIQNAVVPALQTSAFSLLDAALGGNSVEAQKLLANLRVGSDPYEFFGLLVWQANALALVAMAPKISSAELVKVTGLKPFVLQKSQSLASRLGEEKVRQIVAVLATLDIQLKSTGIEAWALVAQAIDKIATSRRRNARKTTAFS
jgi:DNA polymerase-3 subunit delta